MSASAAAPPPMPVTVPQCLLRLTQERRWVGWRWELRKNKNGDIKCTKPPLQVSGLHAHGDKPETWAILPDVLKKFPCNVGLQLKDLSEVAAIDLDKVLRDGAALPWAAALIKRAASYAERTPGGCGLRILGRVPADFPAAHRRWMHPDGGEFEVFANTITGRYITVSGQRLDGTPDELADISVLIRELAALGDGADHGSAGLWDGLPQDLRTCIAHGRTGDRSADFQSAVNSLRHRGIAFGDALALFEAHPAGPAQKYTGRLRQELERSWGKAAETSCVRRQRANGRGDADLEPIDLWGRLEPPSLPLGVLPAALEAFATERAAVMGCDPAGLAAAALCVCAAAIPDAIRLQVKRHDTAWKESARIWVALVGEVSAKKSPILRAAADPLTAIDRRRFQEFCRHRAEFDALPAEERKMAPPPPQRRKRIEDTTPEAAQEVLRDSPEGVLCLQDELAGFFGSLEKYGGKGAPKDRAFWLQAFNGGEYAVNRVGRGPSLVPNLSVCLLGGIQPDPIRRVAGNATDDGLIQRLFPIILRSASLGKDEPGADVATGDYELLIHRLVAREALNGRLLQFTDGAQAIRRELEALHLGQAHGFETIIPKLGAHAGKLDGLFARLCVIFHCVENAGSLDLPAWVGEDVARRVATLMRRFFLPHAIIFHASVLGLSDDHDRLANLAAAILVHGLTRVSARDVARMTGGGSTRGLTADECLRLFEQLEALAWVDLEAPSRANASPACTVNPLVHQRFAERTERERERMSAAREAIAAAFSSHG
jgi:hypothetical protein